MPRLNLPLASFLKRFAAPLLVFNFGMTAPVLFYLAPGAPAGDFWPGHYLSGSATTPAALRLAPRALPLRRQLPDRPAPPPAFRKASRSAVEPVSLIRLPPAWLSLLPDGFYFRRQHHHELPPFHLRPLLDDSVWLEIAAHALEQPYAELLMRDLAAAEPQRDLGLVAFFEEADQVAQLDLVVAFVGARDETSFP